MDRRVGRVGGVAGVDRGGDGGPVVRGVGVGAGGAVVVDGGGVEEVAGAGGKILDDGDGEGELGGDSRVEGAEGGGADGAGLGRSGGQGRGAGPGGVGVPAEKAVFSGTVSWTTTPEAVRLPALRTASR